MSITFERLMLNKFKILIVFFFFLNLSCEIHDIEIPINTSIHSWGYIKDGRDSNLYHISYFDNNRFLDYSINWKKKEFRANYGGVNEFISGLNIMEKSRNIIFYPQILMNFQYFKYAPKQL